MGMVTGAIRDAITGFLRNMQAGEFLSIAFGGTGATTAAAALTALGAQPALGYVPARQSTTFGGPIGGSTSTGVNSGFVKVGAVSFTATAPNLHALASLYVGNSGVMASSYAAYLRIVDTTANQVVATGGTIANYAAAGTGCDLAPVAWPGGLTIGNSITVELWVTSTTGTAGTVQNISIGGANY